MGRSESAILGARPCLPEPPEDRPRIPCDDFDGVPEAQDNCPWSYNPAQENCNLDAEREFGEAERGDRCDSRPCGATVVLPDRIEDFALRGVHVYDYRKIDIDGRVSGRESPTLRTGLRFCRCSVAEEDTVADRHACQFRQEDGSGGCTIGAIEEYREPQFREEDWRRITIIHHRPVPGTEIVVDGEVSGMEEAAVLYDYPSQVRPPIGDQELAALEFIRDVEIDWYFEDDVVRLGWSQDGLRIPWDVNGVLWTHTPGPLDGTYFPDQRRLLTSSYHSRSYGYEMIGNGADAAAGAVPIAPALLPSRRCALCAADFPSPWLMAEPCGGPSSCGDAPEIRFSEGFLDAASFFAPGTAAVLGAAGPWVAASEPMAFLVEDGVRFAAVASDGTSIKAALASSPLGFEALISPPSPGSPPTDLAAEAAGDGTGRGGRGHAAGWRNRPPPRRDFGIALSATEDRLWIVGGVDESGTPVGDLWSFNFRSRTWRRHTLTSTERPGRVLAAAFDPYLGALAVLDLVVQGATETVRLLRMDLPAPWVEVLASWERAGARTTFAMSSVPSGSGYAVACGDPSSHGVLYVSRDPGGVRITGHRQGPGPLASSLLRAEVPGVSLLVEEPDGRAFPVGYSWADLLGADGEAAGLCF